MTEEIYEITLDKFIYGGETMGRLPDGRAVFVPFALPGERVRVRLVFEKKNFARAELLAVLAPAPERIVPRCKHFFCTEPPLSRGESAEVKGRAESIICTGCAYQHMPYPSQLRAKENILRDQLTRIGKIEEPPVQPMVASPVAWRYRSEMIFQLDAQGRVSRPLPDGETQTASGNISECHLPAAAINDFWPQLDFGGNYFEYIALRQDAADELMLVIHATNPETPPISLMDDLSVVHVMGEESIVIGGDAHVVISLCGRPFSISASVFMPPNLALAEKMITCLRDNLPLGPDVTLLELHSGFGLFSAFLAPLAGRLVCVEESSAACDDFSVNLDKFENVELYQAEAETVLPGLALNPDILLADPPVGGLARHTLEGILRLSPATLAYVSHDPSTLARDAARLINGGYRLDTVMPFDVAPQTAQIDCIAIFSQ
ncbi:MAG: TRAM domain-containing protein [Henriciella sp.]|nr:TRAM domain-containing protein [Henriciella sp.]